MDPLDPTLSASCDECGDRDFHFYGLLERHRVDVHGEDEVLHCGICNTAFKRKMNLVLHWRSTAHRDTRMIGCDICDAFNVSNGFENEDKLAEHTVQVHGQDVIINSKEQQEDFSCPLCQKKFSHRKGMIEHLQVLHGEHLFGDLLGEHGNVKQQLLNKLLFRCPDCEKSFRVKSTLNRHREKFHSDYSHWNKNSNPKSELPKQPKPSQPTQQVSGSGVGGGGQSTCPYCQKTFTRFTVLNVHMEMLHSEQMKEDKHKEEEDDDEFGELEEVEDEDEEDTKSEEEVIEIAPDFYHDSSEEADDEETMTQSPLLRMTLMSKPPKPQQKQQLRQNFNLGQQRTGLNNQQRRQLPPTSVAVTPRATDAGNDDSSDDEALPRTANVIVKRISLDYDDADWTTGSKKSKKAKLGEAATEVAEEEVRTSNRIRTKKKRRQEEENESKESSSKEGSSEEPKEEEEESESKDSGEKTDDEVVQVKQEMPPKPPQELVEECVENCGRKFYSFFSMMRHVAFTHRREKTMRLMKMGPPLPPSSPLPPVGKRPMQLQTKVTLNPLLRT